MLPLLILINVSYGMCMMNVIFRFHLNTFILYCINFNLEPVSKDFECFEDDLVIKHF